MRPLDVLWSWDPPEMPRVGWPRCCYADCPVCGRIDTLGRDWGRAWQVRR